MQSTICPKNTSWHCGRTGKKQKQKNTSARAPLRPSAPPPLRPSAPSPLRPKSSLTRLSRLGAAALRGDLQGPEPLQDHGRGLELRQQLRRNTLRAPPLHHELPQRLADGAGGVLLEEASVGTETTSTRLERGKQGPHAVDWPAHNPQTEAA